MLERVRHSKQFRLIGLGLRGVFLTAILLYLVLRLSRIGWGNIAGALPESPLFYSLSVVLFLIVPASETLSYKAITGRKISQGLSIFARKRVFNDALFSYSGEAYLIGRLGHLPGLGIKSAAIAVKDNNLVSALVSNSMTIVLVIAVLAVGRRDILDSIWALSPAAVGTFGAICILLYLITLFFFRKISAMKRDIFLRLTGIHMGKVFLVGAVQMAQWAVGLPAELMTTWLTFLAVQFLLKRIPGLPNTDIVFLGLGISLAGFAHSQPEQVIAMLVAATAMTQLVHLGTFLATLKVRNAIDLSDKAVAK